MQGVVQKNEHPREGAVTWTRWLLVCFPILAVGLLGGCDSTPRQPEEEPGNRAVEHEPEEEVETVVVPRQCMDQVKEFLSREQFVLADHIVIDTSSDPFFTLISATADPDAVEKTEAVDARRRLSLLSLKNRTGFTHLEAVLPQIRVGNGFRVVATKDVLVRFHNRVDRKRPVFLTLKAIGNVIRYDSHDGRKFPADALTLTLEVVAADGGYMFRSRIE
jgi:hypothetical protein